jgi:hypothetical protein
LEVLKLDEKQQIRIPRAEIVRGEAGSGWGVVRGEADSGWLAVARGEQRRAGKREREQIEGVEA